MTINKELNRDIVKNYLTIRNFAKIHGYDFHTVSNATCSCKKEGRDNELVNDLIEKAKKPINVDEVRQRLLGRYQTYTRAEEATGIPHYSISKAFKEGRKKTLIQLLIHLNNAEKWTQKS